MTSPMASPIELDPARLSPLLADLGLPAAITAEHLPGGGQPHWRLTLADGTHLVLRHLPETVIAHEVYVSHLLDGLDLPTKHYLHTDYSLTLLPFAFALTSYIPANRCAPSSGRRTCPSCSIRWGRCSAACTRSVCRLSAISDRMVLRVRAGSIISSTSMSRRALPVSAAEAPKLPWPTPLKAFMANRAVLWRPTGAVFAHNDFQPGNVLARRDADGRLRLAGLIDYGSAVANDPTSDLAKAIFIYEHQSPGSAPALRAGYGPIDHPEPELALELNLLLHRVIMWSWLRRFMPVEAPGLP